MSPKKRFRELKHHFRVLGLKPTFDERLIKERYRKLVLEHHPDAGGDPERFKEINASYSQIIEYLRTSRKEELFRRGSSTNSLETNFLKFLKASLKKALKSIHLKIYIFLFKLKHFRHIRRISLDDSAKALLYGGSRDLKRLHLRVAVARGALSDRKTLKLIKNLLSREEFASDPFARLVRSLISDCSRNPE